VGEGKQNYNCTIISSSFKGFGKEFFAVLHILLILLFIYSIHKYVGGQLIILQMLCYLKR